jgi:hypothetical protein
MVTTVRDTELEARAIAAYNRWAEAYALGKRPPDLRTLGEQLKACGLHLRARRAAPVARALHAKTKPANVVPIMKGKMR